LAQPARAHLPGERLVGHPDPLLVRHRLQLAQRVVDLHSVTWKHTSPGGHTAFAVSDTASPIATATTTAAPAAMVQNHQVLISGGRVSAPSVGPIFSSACCTSRNFSLRSSVEVAFIGRFGLTFAVVTVFL